MQRLSITYEEYLIAEKLFIGSLAPLNSFMTKEDYLSVCQTNYLTNGTFFPFPLSLSVSEKDFQTIKESQYVDLALMNEPVAKLFVTDKFQLNPAHYVENIFNTQSPAHSGVAKYLNQSGFFLGGKIEINTKNPFFLSTGEKTPAEIQEKLQQNYPKTIVGFATRNIPHQGHIHILQQALEWADKLLILISVGQEKKDQYTQQAILKSYDFIFQKYNWQDKAVLDLISMPPSLSGPSEAMMQAIIRKNYGATHFIIGRNHSGIGDFYTDYQAQALAKSNEENLGVKIIEQKGPFYCKECQKVITEDYCTHTQEESKLEISSTNIRQNQLNNLQNDDRVFDEDLWQHLTNQNIKIFCE